MLQFKRVDFDEVDRIREQARRDRANVLGGGIIKGVRAVLRALGGVKEAFADGRRQYELYEQLSRMTDRELRDVGLNRSDIPAVVAGKLARDADWREPKVAAEQAPAQPDERLAA